MGSAGLPGTGIGGLFYVLLALWMPVAELYATLRGRSSAERWRRVGSQFGIACGIVASVVGTVAVLRAVAGGARAPGDLSLALLSAAVSAGVLATLVVVLRVWALVERRRGAPTAAPARGEDPRPLERVGGR